MFNMAGNIRLHIITMVTKYPNLTSELRTVFFNMDEASLIKAWAVNYKWSIDWPKLNESLNLLLNISQRTGYSPSKMSFASYIEQHKYHSYFFQFCVPLYSKEKHNSINAVSKEIPPSPGGIINPGKKVKCKKYVENQLLLSHFRLTHRNYCLLRKITTGLIWYF